MKKKIFIACLMLTFITACRLAPKPAPEVVPATTAIQSAPTSASTSQPAPSSASVNIKADVWADNWFAFYLGEQLVKEDSVSITTERSFNAESFTFNAQYPLVLNIIMKDFIQNDTGLEYIGTSRQQMGDGGLIAQFMNAETSALIAVTDSSWACMVVHEAPLDAACEKSPNPIAGQMPCGFTSKTEPVGWKRLDFDSSAWSPATIFSTQEVGPKEGYDQITWVPSAQFIWGPDLKKDNTVLCRLVINP